MDLRNFWTSGRGKEVDDRSFQSKQRLIGRIAVLLAVLGVSGCSVVPALCEAFGPRKRVSFDVPVDSSTQQVFTCIDHALRKGVDGWGSYKSKQYAVRDVSSGVLETAYYQQPLPLGFHLRAEFSQEISTLKLSLFGSGGYCSDPGVDKEMARLKSEISSCVNSY